MQDAWDPGRYETFAAERAQPFWDLVDLVEDAPLERAVDLGCGTGSLTAQLVVRRGIGSMLGLDASPAMLAEAAAHAGANVRFAPGDLASWTSAADHDLVLSNAALQWVPDHEAVLERWWAALRAGGQLAVQVPANADHPSHVVAAEVAASEPFRSAMGGTPPPDPVATNVLVPDRYATLLHELGARRQHVRLQVYGHVLAGPSDVVRWVQGTTLTRFTNVLPAALHEEFLATYSRRLLAVLGDGAPFFYAFKRILFWGRK
jgi:trans-aconitate 2-methyltransferase